MSRSSALTGRAIAALAALLAALLSPLNARADDVSHLWFAGTRLIFEHAVPSGGELAVGTADGGLARFLGRVGATLSWDASQRNIIVTSADRRIIRFTLGDPHYSVGNTLQSAPLTPYAANGEAFLPLYTLAHALGIEAVRDQGEIVLQPQIYALDVKNAGKSVTITISAATPIRFKAIDDGERLELVLGGVSTALDQSRSINAGGLTELTIVPGGSVRGPFTTLTFAGAGAHAMLPSISPNMLVLSFGGAGATLGGAPVPPSFTAAAPAAALGALPVRVTGALPPARADTPAPLPPASPGASAQPSPVASAGAGSGTTVTAVEETAVGDGLSVRIAVSGGATYEWHRLMDNRFFVDIKNATLGFPGRDDQPPSSSVPSVRIRQIATAPIPIVRVALTLTSSRQVDVVNTGDGLAVAVSGNDEQDPPLIGAGEINGGMTYSPPPAANLGFVPLPPHAGNNSKLIVIDPGHGGSDIGAAHNGLMEKDITLDISRRLKAILIARGWQVKMTRETDVDVFAPNDSARDELQARSDVANNAGARLFVSVHINSSTSSAINGTTSYWYKPEDKPLAAAIQHRLMSVLPTNDLGVRKEAFYVMKHTSAPASLVETAFISNPSDAALMRSPDFLQKVAQAIADGIADFTGLPQGAAPGAQ